MESHDLALTMFLMFMCALYMMYLKQEEQYKKLTRLENMLSSVPGVGDGYKDIHPRVRAKIVAGEISAAIILHRSIEAISFGEAESVIRSYIAHRD
ncbi:hypothetical protein INH39_31795 [Massilia violaceinigra]|uniref:Uncharacterized protein n=1 Tax=Massilia violaceinigra TaxID=2045208 RepID=A0ABY4A573_9BURK|nr:hypothetical protein [Massilia violaceinigra]UOD29897.1 hypothetical protein INH39_31795 [Massilia violaceinigra]